MSMLHTVRVGRRGTGEPLLLLHGTGSNHRIWARMLPALGGSFDVMAVDLPGFGQSPPTRRPPTPAVLAESAASAMDRVGWGDAHVVGHSLGGIVGIELAASGRVRTLTAISPAGMATRWEAAYARAMLRLHRALGRPIPSAVPYLLRSAVLRGLFLAIPAGRAWRWSPAEAAQHAASYCSCPGFHAAVNATPFRAADERLALVTCPVLILWGTRDALLFPWQARRWGAALPHAEVRMLRGLGHSPQPDSPQLLADAVLAFAGQGSERSVGEVHHVEAG
jgi:pimeloyl-ACP methyl ester carboxylesterase